MRFHVTLAFNRMVAFPYKISNKFIEDFERIMDFVEHKNINLNCRIISL